MAITIDTQSAQYQQYLNGLQNLIDFYKPKLALFEKLPKDKQKLWLQKDPLLRKFLKVSLWLAKWAAQFSQEVEND